MLTLNHTPFLSGIFLNSTGQAPVIHRMPYLYKLIAEGKIDPSDVVTHILPLDQAKKGYEMFDAKTHDCIKVVLKP